MSDAHALFHAVVTGAGGFLVWLFVSSTVVLIAGLAATLTPRLSARGAYAIGSLAMLAPAALLVGVIADPRALVARMLPPAEAGGEAFVSLGEVTALGAGPPVAEWPCAVAAIWLAGLLVALSRLVVEHARWSGVVRRAEPLSLAAFERARARAGVAPPLRSSGEIDGPLVAGFVKAAILLPSGLERALAEDELETIFLHELAHVRRRDNLSAVFHEIVLALAWFDPIHRLARRRLVALRERACDAAVADSGGDAASYLAALGKACAPTMRPAAVSCMSGFNLRERMDSIMTYSSRRPSFVSHRAALAAGASALLVLVAASAFVAPGVSFATPAGDVSEKHTLEVRMSPHPDGRVAVRVVVRTPAGEVVMQSYAAAPEGKPVELRTVTNDRMYEVRTTASAAGAGEAVLEVFRGGRLDERVEVPVRRQDSETATMNLHMRDADIHDVLTTISRLTGMRMVTPASLSGRVSIEAEAMPWDVVLARVLAQVGHVFVPQDEQIVVMPMPQRSPATQRPLPEGMYRVGGDVKAPRIISRVDPIYPAEARAARISGVVIVEAVISESGVVEAVHVLKGLPFGLSEAAADAVRQWIFTPATIEGRAVPVVFNLTINFKVTDDPAPRETPAARTSVEEEAMLEGFDEGLLEERADAHPPALDPLVTLPEGLHRVDGDVKPPRAIWRVEPVYTPKARAARIAGAVVLEAVISETGTVEDVRVIKGLPFGLSESAVDAVRRWIFAPATLEGKPVPVKFNLTMGFRP